MLFRSGIRGPLSEPVVEEKIFEPRERPWYRASRDRSSEIWTSIYIDFRTQGLVATRARRVPAADGGGYRYELRQKIYNEKNRASLTPTAWRDNPSSGQQVQVVESDGSLGGLFKKIQNRFTDHKKGASVPTSGEYIPQNGFYSTSAFVNYLEGGKRHLEAVADKPAAATPP